MEKKQTIKMKNKIKIGKSICEIINMVILFVCLGARGSKYSLFNLSCRVADSNIKL